MLDNGKIINNGDPKALLKDYHDSLASTEQPELHDFDPDNIEKSEVLKKYIHLGPHIFIQSKSSKTFVNLLDVKNDKGLNKNIFQNL